MGKSGCQMPNARCRTPDAERDMCICCWGYPDTESALGCDPQHTPQVAGGLSVRPRPPDSSMPNRASRPWTGATPLSRCPVRASARVGTDKPVPPSRGSLPVQQSLQEGEGGPGRVRPGLGRRCRTAHRPNRSANGSSTASKRRSTPFRDGSMLRERPLGGGGERVKPRSPLCRTEPSARGVAPAPAISARSTLDDRATWPHDVTKASVARLLPCESAECRIVNRPPASFSHRGAARGGTPKDVDVRAPPPKPQASRPIFWRMLLRLLRRRPRPGFGGRDHSGQARRPWALLRRRGIRRRDTCLILSCGLRLAEFLQSDGQR